MCAAARRVLHDVRTRLATTGDFLLAALCLARGRSVIAADDPAPHCGLLLAALAATPAQQQSLKDTAARRRQCRVQTGRVTAVLQTPLTWLPRYRARTWSAGCLWPRCRS
nr:hypothetical protein XAC3615_12480001 [Xanthomonas citri pv. citri]CEH47983.1 hypothetical protein XACLD7_13360001 [Xanthomonas citri pv. citri]